MPIIRAKRPDGGEITGVMPEQDRQKTIEEFKKKGCTDIHDAETLEKYN